MWRRPLGVIVLGGLLVAPGCVGATAALGAGPIDLHRVDWNRAVLPGSVCGADRPIALHTGYATVHSRRWPSVPRVSVDRGRVVFGDLNGSGRDDAALQIVCANLGGTAAGQLAFAVVVYAPGVRAPKVVGVLTPVLRSSGRHPPILVPLSLADGKVTVGEYVYGPHDADCCPTGRARTVWRLRAGAFRPVSTVVLRAPA